MTNTCPSITDQLLDDLNVDVEVLHGDDTADIQVSGPADAHINVGDVAGGLDLDCVNADVLNGLNNGNPLLFVDLTGPVDGNVLVGGDEGTCPYNALITADLDLPELGGGGVPDIGHLPVDAGNLPVDLGCIGGLLDSVDLPV
jgi:hypothetical protein